MFNFFNTETERINRAISKNAITNLEIIKKEIVNFKISQRRRDMFSGELYFAGKHDILSRERQIIDRKSTRLNSSH